MDTLKMGSDKKNVTPPLDKTSIKCYTNIVKGMNRIEQREAIDT